jgi:hypothetical protein
MCIAGDEGDSAAVVFQELMEESLVDLSVQVQTATVGHSYMHHNQVSNLSLFVDLPF